MQIEHTLNAFSQLGATWVLWLLIGLSVAALAVIIERSAYLTLTRDRLGDLREELRSLLQGSNVGDGITRAKARLSASPSPEARVVGAGLLARTPEEAEERMQSELSMQRLAMEKNLAFLGTLGANAPFIGLLGTVIGIIGAFQELDASAGKVSSGLMTEVGEALVATAVGLLVALPAVAAFNAFHRIIQVRLTRGSALGRELLAAHFASVAAQKESDVHEQESEAA
jgi:biopolymer transport protein ExbB